MPFNLPISPLQIIAEHPGKDRGISLFIKRDDLLHPEICGSKWRKLAAILPSVLERYPDGIVTFGGPFSNHLNAVAIAGRLFNIPAFGIVRGKHSSQDNPTLQAAEADGMTIFLTSKHEYDANKNRGVGLLGSESKHYFLLPEGGNTALGLKACTAIPWEISAQLIQQNKKVAQAPLFLCAPAGTGCTAAGIVAGVSKPNTHVLIFPVSRHGVDKDAILRMIAEADLSEAADWGVLEQGFSLVSDYMFGGFATLHPPAMDFVRYFFGENSILLDPIYTSKMLFGVFDMLAKGEFPQGSTVVVLHTGGLQGWAGFAKRYGDAGRV